MASTSGPEAEIHDSRRQPLLQALSDALSADIPPTAWACLWLSDIDKLQDIVSVTQAKPLISSVLPSYFRDMEKNLKMVQKCKVIQLILRR